MLIEIITSFSIAILCYVLVTYVSHIRDRRRLPPGPFPLPLIGNLNLVRRDFHKVCYALSKKYGGVFSFSLGTEILVIVNKVEPAREALVSCGSTFAGRDTSHYGFAYLTNGFSDMVFADYGPYWIRARKLVHSALKIYGDGLGNLERRIIGQYEKLNDRLMNKRAEPVDLPTELGLTVLNVICSKVFNQEYEINDPEFLKLMEFIEIQGEGFSSVDIFFLGGMPSLRVFPLKCLRKFKQAIEIRDPYVKRKLKEHEDTFDSKNIRDFTDSLINALNDDNGSDDNRTQQISHLQLEMIIADILFAGFESTWKTMHWSILYLLHWPEYQEEMFQQIVSRIKNRRYPTIKDRQDLPIVQAVIQEILRLSSVAAFSIAHKAIESGSIDGNPVPKGTNVLFNFWAIHHDEEEWANPDMFDPYRWIDDEGMYQLGKNRSFLPFAAGRRVCPGESIAKTELFLLLTRIVRDFKLSPDLSQPMPSLIGSMGVIYNPCEFNVILTPRN